MPTKRKLRKREHQKARQVSWDLGRNLVDYALKHLKVFRQEVLKYPSHPSDLKSVEEWIAEIDDMIYFAETMEIYSEGHIEELTPGVNPFLPSTKVDHGGTTMYRMNTNPEYKANYYHGLDAVKYKADYERFKRGRYLLLTRLNNLWI